MAEDSAPVHVTSDIMNCLALKCYYIATNNSYYLNIVLKELDVD